MINKWPCSLAYFLWIPIKWNIYLKWATIPCIHLFIPQNSVKFLKNKKKIWSHKRNSLKWNHLTLLVITWNDWMVDDKLACQYEGEGFYSLLWHLVHIFKAYKWPKDLTHAILIWRWFLFMVRFSFSTLDFKILECIFHSFRFINEFVMNEFMIFKLWILSNIWVVLSCLISKSFKVKWVPNDKIC
jgi:hypothetical protein